MKVHLNAVIIVVAILLAVTIYCPFPWKNGNAYESSIKEEYELQDRFSKRAELWFEKAWGGKNIHKDADSQKIVSYKNHYNKKLNKCFFIRRNNCNYVKKGYNKSRSYNQYCIG